MGWEDVDEICPTCNQITKKAKGINKQNIKRLLWSKPSFNEWFTLAVIILVLLVAWAYKHDISTCRQTLSNLTEICVAYGSGISISNNAFNNSMSLELLNKSIFDKSLTGSLT